MTESLDASSQASSHKEIVRSSAIVGSAAVITNILGVIRLKIVALLLGPVGIGLIALYLNFASTAGAIAAVGLNTSGVREIASAEVSDDKRMLSASVIAIISLALAFAVVAMSAIWIFRETIAGSLLSDPTQSEAVAWLSLATGLTVLSVVPTTLLNGFRRIGALAIAQVLGAVLGTIVGLSILVTWGAQGLIGYVLAAPAAAALAGVLLCRIPRGLIQWSVQRSLVLRQARRLLSLGMTFMLGSVALGIGVLLIRAHIYAELGQVALGHFAAAWMISNVYLVFVVQALGTDFYPRISSVVDDRGKRNQLLNEQIEASVLLALPALLATLAIAPWMLQALYTSAFVPAADLLRWQVLGDLFKVLSYPLVMTLLAARRGTAYLIIELSAAGLYVAFVWLSSGTLGLISAGVGYLLMYVSYFIILLVTVGRVHGFSFRTGALWTVVGATAVAVVVTTCALRSDIMGLIVGLLAALAAGLWTIRRLHRLGALPRRLSLRIRADETMSP